MKTFTEKEAVSLRCIVDVLEKHGAVPQTFKSQVKDARARLDLDDPQLTASHAAALCAATHKYLKSVPIETLPPEVQVVFASAYEKLIGIQKDEPVFVNVGDGWGICVNGSIARESFETEERARFYWSIRPWPLN
jgi:hypothetical protein